MQTVTQSNYFTKQSNDETDERSKSSAVHNYVIRSLLDYIEGTYHCKCDVYVTLTFKDNRINKRKIAHFGGPPSICIENVVQFLFKMNGWLTGCFSVNVSL